MFVLALVLLIVSADLFVDKSEELGRSIGFSTFLVGLIIVSIGTTLPELASSIYATIKGSSEIVIPTVIGSVTTNVFLVVGLVCFLYGTKFLYRETLKTDLWILVTVCCLFLLFIIDRKFTLVEAIFCILLFFVYSFYQYKLSKPVELEEPVVKSSIVLCILQILLYSILIYVGSKYVVDSMLEISTLLRVPAEIIAITVIALGTSLTELTVGLISVRKGHIDIAIGNIIGASIIDLLIVTGIPRLFGDVVVPAVLFTVAIPIFGFAIVSFIYVVLDKKLTKLEGGVFLLMYLLFNIIFFLV